MQGSVTQPQPMMVFPWWRHWKLWFCSWLHPAAGPVRALQETQTISKGTVLSCWRNIEFKGNPNMVAQPLVASSSPKHLLQALGLCTDMRSGVLFLPIPHIPVQWDGAGWVVWYCDVGLFPTPKNRSLHGFGATEFCIAPWQLLLLWRGVSPLQPGVQLLQQNSLSVWWEFSKLVPGWGCQSYLHSWLRPTPGKIPLPTALLAVSLTGSGGVLSWLPGNGCSPQAVSSGDAPETLQFPFFIWL